MQDGSLIALSGYVLDADASDASPVNDAYLSREPMNVAWAGESRGETALSEKDLNAIGCFEGPASSRPPKAYLLYDRTALPHFHPSKKRFTHRRIANTKA